MSESKEKESISLQNKKNYFLLHFFKYQLNMVLVLKLLLKIRKIQDFKKKTTIKL